MIRVDLKKALHTSDGMINLRVDFHVKKDELVTLFGKSGSGKSTILRMIAGLTRPDEGFIEVEGESWFDSRKRIDRPIQQRQIGFVFQEYTLFPNMTVEENLRFALSNRRELSMIDELLDMMHLTQLRGRKPGLLSGGQKQRVALIRALLRRPKIFLLDEPLSALDLDLRLKLQDELIEIHRRFNIPTIFVSHDLSEVFKLSSRIFFLEGGVIKKESGPENMFSDQSNNGDFQFPGTVLDIQRQTSIYTVTVLVGNHLTRVIVTEIEAKDLKPGDKILVAVKAHNPIILKR